MDLLHRIALNATDLIVPIMLGVLFALLAALALWLFVDLPLFESDAAQW